MFDSIVTQVIMMVCSYSEDFSKKVQCLHHKADLGLWILEKKNNFNFPISSLKGCFMN